MAFAFYSTAYSDGPKLEGSGLYRALAAPRHDVANARTSRLAPPTSAPSTSGCAISSRMLSGLTLPP